MFSSVIDRLNDKRDAAGESGEDAGFTLIELMVVLLILAILLAIAIPTFLGVTKSANDRATQSNLNTGLVNAKATFQNNSQSYALTTANAANTGTNASLMAASLSAAEPALAFTTGAVTQATATGQSVVSVAVSADGNALILAELSKSTGNCFFVIDNTQTQSTTTNGSWSSTGFPVTAGTFYGEAKNVTAVPTCNALAAPAASTTGQLVSYQASGFPSL